MIKKLDIMKARQIILATCLGVMFFASQNVKAQYDAMFTQYMFNEMFINPAYAGSKEAMAVTGVHRQQWVNFPGRPITTTFSMHGPIVNEKMGFGLSFLNEKIGSLNRNLAYLSYSYKIKAGKNGNLAFGLMGGVHNQVNKFSQLKATEEGDVQISQNSPSVYAPNFGFGIYYSDKVNYAGLSIPRMIDDHILFDANGDYTKVTKMSPQKFHYYLTLGRIFTLTDGLKLKGQAMIKAVQNAPLQYDLNANFLIKEKIWAGLSYRSGDAVSAILGIQVSPQFVVSYSYDYTLSQIQKYSQGSHEIALSYVFKYKGKNVITPRYF
ncbi:MAG: type IX secretion system membrane protein PorP/SprF [Bacteroidia bacterium]|nr:type IX secretion system membrane protein PorP/SprF [Bacteroidia bacterium]